MRFRVSGHSGRAPRSSSCALWRPGMRRSMEQECLTPHRQEQPSSPPHHRQPVRRRGCRPCVGRNQVTAGFRGGFHGTCGDAEGPGAHHPPVQMWIAQNRVSRGTRFGKMAPEFAACQRRSGHCLHQGNEPERRCLRPALAVLLRFPHRQQAKWLKPGLPVDVAGGDRDRLSCREGPPAVE